MHIPNDPERRFWVEAADENPHLVEQFRSVVVGFLAFNRAREAHFAGSGFIISTGSKFARVLTAKHVMQEGVMRIQKPESVSATQSIFASAKYTVPSADPNDLLVIWGGPQHSAALGVLYGEYADMFDLCLCLVSPHPENPDTFAPVSVPIETTIPNVGDVVRMVSLYRLASTELRPPVDRSSVGQELLMDWRVSIRVGIVTGVYLDGYRQYRWPCFTTSIPAEPGMSGGLVYIPKDSGTVGACGVVCADCSTDIARLRHDVCGESIVACAWPALALRSPVGAFSKTKMTLRTLYEMACLGELDMPVGGIDHIDFSEGRISLRKR